MNTWIDVTLLGSGWAAVQYWINDMDFPGKKFVEPYATDAGRYGTREEAEEAATIWALCSGIPLNLTNGPPTSSTIEEYESHGHDRR